MGILQIMKELNLNFPGDSGSDDPFPISNVTGITLKY